MARSFSPQIIRRHRIKGKNVDAMVDFLPGYVFAYSETAYEDFTQFRGIDGMIRRLGTRETDYTLAGADYEFALSLYRKNGVVGQVTVFQVGDEVVLDDPLFNNCKGKITRIDHRKQRCRVDYRFSGMDCYTWVACELVYAAKPSGLAGQANTAGDAAGDGGNADSPTISKRGQE